MTNVAISAPRRHQVQPAHVEKPRLVLLPRLPGGHGRAKIQLSVNKHLTGKGFFYLQNIRVAGFPRQTPNKIPTSRRG